ncbi:MAG: hypothetical protein JKY94_17815 [Rhodobacteraceae bacterium]|nr:hypothetical protein [Paracoccaceae bacterium]
MEDRTSTLTLAGGEYSLRRMPPVRALAFAPRVAAFVAGTGKAINPEIFKGMLAGGKSAEGVGLSAVMDALGAMDPADMTALMREALSYEVFSPNSTRLGDDVEFDKWFVDHPGDMFAVAAWAVWEHSKDFFTGSLDSFQRVFTGAAPQTSKSPTGGSPSTT